LPGNHVLTALTAYRELIIYHHLWIQNGFLVISVGQIPKNKLLFDLLDWNFVKPGKKFEQGHVIA